jgi:outer membrane lipoprotein carrier protein
MGQTKLTSEQEKQVLAKMEKSSNALRTLQCDFVQSKRMKLLSKEMQSKGVLYFVKPDKIRWQYTTPYDYTFIMNGDKVQIKSAKSTKNIDIQGNKIFRQITTIILNTVTGGGIMNSADFDVTLFKQGEVYFAKMLPKKKEVKQVYASIEVYFNPTLTMVESIKMIEKSGEYTTVKLLSPKVNTTINESVFKVN